MSDKVLKFKKPDNEQHASGDAICICCKHEWIAIAPTGTVNLECPNCHTMKGHFKFQHNVGVGQLIRVCNCGNDLFRITPLGHMCANCGIYQSYD